MSKQVNGKSVSLYIDESKLRNSVHGDLFSCVDCHKSANDPVNKNLRRPAACVDCHADEQKAYEHSQHAKAKKDGASTANCADCHGGAHEILAAGDPRSTVNHANIPTTCGKCHTEMDKTLAQSVQGQAIARGNGPAQVCTDCHGIHSTKTHSHSLP